MNSRRHLRSLLLVPCALFFAGVAGQTAQAADKPATSVQSRKSDATPIGETQNDACDIPPHDTDSLPHAERATRKFHPGHYVSLNQLDSIATMTRVTNPGVIGIQKRYLWKTLEPAPGKYDFSAIRSDLDFLVSHDLQLVVFLVDKSFDRHMPTPDYLKKHVLPNSSGGYTAARWQPYVVDRMKALLAALGRQFDCHPQFEGVAIQESALGLTDSILAENDYSPERYRDGLIEILLGAASAMPASQVFWYMNFLPRRQGYIADIAEAVAPAGVAMGGPDALPDNPALKSRTYPFYDEFENRMTLFTSMQYNSYAHKHDARSRSGKYWTMDELFRFARDELHVDYIFWNHKTWRKPADSYDWTDALPIINENARFPASRDKASRQPDYDP